MATPSLLRSPDSTPDSIERNRRQIRTKSLRQPPAPATTISTRLRNVWKHEPAACASSPEEMPGCRVKGRQRSEGTLLLWQSICPYRSVLVLRRDPAQVNRHRHPCHTNGEQYPDPSRWTHFFLHLSRLSEVPSTRSEQNSLLASICYRTNQPAN